MKSNLGDGGAISHEVAHHRLNWIDIVRGLAIAGVVLFHAVWNLEFFGFISGVASHPAWLLFGRILAGTFMFLVGASLVLAHIRGFRIIAFGRRLLVVAAAALSITLITWVLFPETFIYYGILHSIFVASLFGIIFVQLPTILVLSTGIAALALPEFVSAPFFDSRSLAWTGLFITPPPSVDFVPFFPWAGLTLLGIAFTKTYVIRFPRDQENHPLLKNLLFGNSLIWMGRHSLAIYLVHQPVLFSIVSAAASIFS